MKAQKSAWCVQHDLLRRLNFWAVVNSIGGFFLLLRPGSFYQAVGQQFIAWGAINFLISLLGKRSLSNRKRGSEADASVEAHERVRLGRILWINTALDILYVLGGFWLASSNKSRRGSAAGHGVGIMFQGAGLLLLDIYHALLLKTFRSG